MEPTYEYIRGKGWVIETVESYDTTWDVWDDYEHRHVKKRVRLFGRPALPGEYSRSKPLGYGYDRGGKADLYEWAALDALECWEVVKEPVIPEPGRVHCAMIFL